MPRFETLLILLLFCTRTLPSYAIPSCPGKIPQAAEIETLLHKIAVIGKDGRRLRQPGDAPEAAQGRFWCLKKDHSRPQGKISVKNLKENYMAANAVLAFEDDVAIVNRHMFQDRNDAQKASYTDCLYEQVASGELVEVIAAEFSDIKAKQDPTAFMNEDVALIRLLKAPDKGKAIPAQHIVTDDSRLETLPLEIVSNCGMNPGIKNPLLPTITSCYRVRYISLTGADSHVYGTNCSTGRCSSGSQAYVNQNGTKLLVGIVSGENHEKPEGGDYETDSLATFVTTFDSRLFEMYKKLKHSR